MHRMACVDLPAMPLQILRRRHPDWAGFPAVVVVEDRAQGKILWADPLARRKGIFPGMLYSAGLALASSLRARPPRLRGST